MLSMKFPINTEDINPCPVCGDPTIYIIEDDQTGRYSFAHFCYGVEQGEIFKMITTEDTYKTEQEAIDAWNETA